MKLLAVAYLLYESLLDETEIVLTAREFCIGIFRAKGVFKSEYYKYRTSIEDRIFDHLFTCPQKMRHLVLTAARAQRAVGQVDLFRAPLHAGKATIPTWRKH